MKSIYVIKAVNISVYVGGGEFSYELKRLEIANERMWNEVSSIWIWRGS